MLQKMPRKPWEDKNDEPSRSRKGSMDALLDKETEDKAWKNIEKFVGRHLVTKHPINEGEQLQTLVGTSVFYEVKNGVKFFYPGNIRVVEEKEAANGAIWVLDGVLD